jgi:hypothetical protein
MNCARCETLEGQLNEAKRLLSEAQHWIGVDPTYEESVAMDALGKKIAGFLGKSEEHHDHQSDQR